MEQTTLAIEVEHGSETPSPLLPVTRRRAVELMAEAIVAAHRASPERAHEEDADDDARD